MAFSQLTISIFVILSVALFVQMGAGDDPLKRIGADCRNSNHFPARSKYHKNLSILLNDLQNKTPDTGFALEFVGEPKTGRGVYGRSFCRGDISRTECKACVGAVIARILEKCPLKKGAVGLSEICSLIYSHRDIFHKYIVDTYYISRGRNISISAPVETITKFVNNLTDKATATKTFFATGDVKLADESGNTIYGLVQCALDLSPADCESCIAGMLERIPDFTPRGGRFVSAACTLQYEFYQFFIA
ncbi:antimicrobial ginkbilobin-2-like protein [Coffea arabica]|uniref:Antimicrobial ginkbilobin-2-like protein n=1 Tax=Coffea arabica TaxID=13443 RepID=A0A6P6UGB0_COFAR|nr:cysteine-rich repeat secretory protein 38-like [Coffea arabica]